MKQQDMDLDETIVRQYLLDELPLNEREQLEMRLLTDDDFFAQLIILEEAQEDELIDQFVNEELSEREREKFKRVFLSTPERKEKLNLIKDLKAHATTPVQPAKDTDKRNKKTGWWFTSFLAFRNFQNPILGFSLTTALLFMGVSSTWLFFKVRGLESELSRLKAEQMSPPVPMPDKDAQEQLAQLRARNDEIAAALKQAEAERATLGQELSSLRSQKIQRPVGVGYVPHPPQRMPTISLALSLIQGRGAEPGKQELNLPSDPARVQLLLDLDVIDPQDYKDYRVIIKRRDGTIVKRINNPLLQSQGGENRLVVNLPADRLPEGEYLTELSGLSGGVRRVIGIYTFRSLKK